MTWKILKYLGAAVACLVVATLSSALLYRKYLQHKRAEERAIRSPNGIDSLEPVRIGGIDQWIEVRGQNMNNPILLFIHGGPGTAFIPFAGAFQGPWERYFTVVQWDQRGAGKTYTSNNAEVLRRTMNVAQMEQDTLDVANYLRNRFKREKIGKVRELRSRHSSFTCSTPPSDRNAAWLASCASIPPAMYASI